MGGIPGVPEAPRYATTGDWSTNPDRNCAGLSTAMFFPPDGANGPSLNAVKRICIGCPVFAECREFALSDPGLSGVWAGMTRLDRRKIRKAEGYSKPSMARVRPAARCGTTSGYNRHREHQEEPCQSCREARNAYEAERKQRLRVVV